jgi:NADPH:quinone reductase-like Zn-dependent oxidoreductase
MKTFGIPAERIFSSRTTDFSNQIMIITNGEGIDVILNSLTGDLLDESWRIIADGGTMVEIGKKDIIDRNKLSMEPFGRNASFRAVDFSHKQISDALIAKCVVLRFFLTESSILTLWNRILAELFDLIRDGHVKPIAPIKLIPFDDIPAAFRFMRGGKHVGKIVISSGPDAKAEVPVSPKI